MKLRRILIFLGLLVGIVILISVIRHYQLRAATNAYIAELKAKGELIDLAQVLSPPLPADENSSEIFLKVAASFPTNQTLLSSNYFYGGMMMVAPGKAMVRATQPDLRDSTSTNSWQEVHLSVAQNADLFTSLHQLIDKPNFDFGVSYQEGITELNFTNLHLPALKSTAMRLGVASLDRLHRRDADGAVMDVRTMLAIVKGTERERLVISELVRIAMTTIAINDIWEILQSTNVTEQQLAAVQEDCASLEFFRAQENALEMERVSGRISLGNWRSSNAKFLRDLTGGNREPAGIASAKIKVKMFCWTYWWSYSDELKALEGYQCLLAASRSATTNSSLLAIQKELQTNLAKLSIPTKSGELWNDVLDEIDLHSLLSEGVGSVARVFDRIMKVETARQLTLAAIALKRYHLKHAAYPESLAVLVPEFLHEVPRDPMDGQPLRYRLNADGTFLLYSIGDDGKDDGGNPNPPDGATSIQWQRGRDWVWPQPATAEEIQKFYQNPPK